MVPSDDVAGSIEALAPVLRVGDETARGEARTPEVATSQTRAADVQLTGDARRHWPQESVEDAKAGSAEGPADRRWRPIGAEWARHGGNDRRLRRPVGVEHRPSRGEAEDEFRTARLGTDQKGSQTCDLDRKSVV